MNNWHHKVIKMHLLSAEDSNGSDEIFISITEGFPEYISSISSSDEDYRFKVIDYKIAHPKLQFNKKFFNRQASSVFDKENKFYTEDVKLNYFNNKKYPSIYFSTHTSIVSSIAVGLQNNSNFIKGISPSTNIITTDNFVDVGMATLTSKYLRSNIDSEYFSNKINEAYLITNRQNRKIVIHGEEPENDNIYNKEFASIVNFSASWPITGDIKSGKPRNSGNTLFPRSVDFIIRDLFAYGRNGKGCLFVCSSGNGKQDEGSENPSPVGYDFSVSGVVETRPFAYSKKSFIVGASKAEVSFPQDYITTQIPNFIETKSEYSNFGSRLDICAPSNPSGKESAGDLSIYGATNLKCGNIGNFDTDYIDFVVKKVNADSLVLQGNTKCLFPGQAIELGVPNTFLHESRFITKINHNKDGTTEISLNLPLKYTANNIIKDFSLINQQVKVLVWKKTINKVSNNPFQISIDDTRGIQKKQDVFIFSNNELEKGKIYEIDFVNYEDKLITLKEKLSNEFQSNLLLIPGQIQTTINFLKNENFKLSNPDISKGFFAGQMVMVGDDNIITNISNIHHRNPDNENDSSVSFGSIAYIGNGSSLILKSLSYGDYTSRFGGTSAATPIVSGVAALVLSANKNLNASEIKHILKTTTDQIGGQYKINTTINSNYNFNYNVNDFFGTGRVNAYKAVNLAKIWHNPNNTSFKKPKLRFASSAFQPFIYIDGAVDGNFNTNTDQKIKVRLENYGNLHSFQETDLRILVAFTNEDNPKFKFPDYWYENKINSVDENGKKLETKVCLLDVQEIIPIAPGTETNPPISIDWKDIRGFLSKKGYDSKIHKIFILAHIAPFDGTNSDLAGYTSQNTDYNNSSLVFDITNNKNLAAVEIIPTVSVPSKKLSDGTKVPLNGENYNLIATNIEKEEKFCIDIYNVQAPELDTKQFKFSLLNKPNGIVESEVIIKKTNGNWDLSNLPNWLTADIVETGSVLYAATHKNAEINYALSYDLTKAGKQIQFAVI